MFESNLKVSDKLTVLAQLVPVSQVAATVTTGWVSAADYAQYAAIIMTGVIAAGGTLNAKFEQATSSGGAGAKDVLLSAITAMTQAGGDGSQIVFINFDPNKGIDRDNSFTHIRLSVTTAVAASLLAALLVGMDARYSPGTQIAGVKEVVSVI